MIETLLGRSDLPVLQSELFLSCPAITHFCTLRGCDNLLEASAYDRYNMCHYTGDSDVHVATTRQLFADALAIHPHRLWFPRQVHGTTVVEVNESTPPDIESDAVITTLPGLCIGVSTADCVPVLLYDPQNQVIAAVHAGWRGTVAHIVEKTIQVMSAVHGTNPSHIHAMIGPSISPEAFEVGEEVAEAFDGCGRSACICREGYPKPHIDLWKANVMDLLQVGVNRDCIDCTPLCTHECHEKLFSARRLGIRSGRIASCIMIKE